MPDTIIAPPRTTVTVSIDGQSVSVAKGKTVLDACNESGIVVPTFCWHPKLKSVGACRICYVEIEKFPKLMVSCSTEATEGMVVHTNSAKTREGRKAVIEFTLLDHPLDCPTCDKGGECDLQDHTFDYGLTDETRYDFDKSRFIRDRKSTFDDLQIGPEIIRNQNRCILCYKCTRANEEVFGEHDLGVYNRGDGAEIFTAPGEQVDSLYSGNLVEICPVGALTASDWRYKIRVWNTRTEPSVCPYHSDGANTLLWKDGLRVHRATSRANQAVDEGWLSDITRYGYQIANSPKRLTTPLVKKNGQHQPVSWAEAVRFIAGKLKEIKTSKGPEQIGTLVSPNLDASTLWAANKLMRGVVGSNNIDYRITYADVSKTVESVYDYMSARPFELAKIDKSDVILVFGSNLLREHPNAHLWARGAVTKNGAHLFTVNPFETKSGDCSFDEMICVPGSEEAFLNGLTLALLAQGATPDGVDVSRVESLLAPNTLADCATVCGVSLERIDRLARMLSVSTCPCIIVGELVSASLGRENIAKSLYNTSVLLGIDSGARGQAAILAKASNSAGATMLGLTPELSAENKTTLKTLLGAFPDNPMGLNIDQMLMEAQMGNLSTLLVLGANPLQLSPDRAAVSKALSALSFLVVADLFESPTTAMADVVLPLASFAEYAGVYVNLEGRVQTTSTAMRAVGESLPGYEILQRIAREMGYSLIADMPSFTAEITSALEKYVAPTRTRHLMESHYCPSRARGANELALYVGDSLHHYGHWTTQCHSLVAFDSAATVEISPATASAIGVENGQMARIARAGVSVNAAVKISQEIEAPVALLSHNFADVQAHTLTSRSEQVVYVTIEKV